MGGVSPGTAAALLAEIDHNGYYLGALDCAVIAAISRTVIGRGVTLPRRL